MADPFGVNGRAPNRREGNAWLDNTDRRDRATFGGGAQSTDPETGQQFAGTANQAAQKYESKANDHANRQAYQLNYGQANQSFDQANQDRNAANMGRAVQYDALGMQRQAALGNQPSRVEIMGRGLIDQSLQSQLAAGASAKGGPLGQMMAQRNAQQGAAAFQQQGMNQLSAMRAGEMADARNAYMQGATGIRGQDYQGAAQAAQMAGQQAQMAQAQGALEMGQRQLNQQGEMGYDQMGWNTLNEQANRNLEEDKLAAMNWQKQMDTNAHRTDKNTDILASLAGGIGEGLGSIFSSDERTKIPVLEFGGPRSGPADATFAGSSGMAGGGGPIGELKAHSAFATRFARNPGAQPSDERTKRRVSDVEIIRFGESNRGDPQMEAMLDDRHHEEAHRAGAVPYWLEDEMNRQSEEDKPLQYGSSTEKGVAGAPKGYAAARQAQSGGYRWGDNLAKDEARGVAPGTTDFEDTDPNRPKPLLLEARVGRGLRGFGRHFRSDDRAKQKAFEQGLSVATRYHTGKDTNIGVAGAYDFQDDEEDDTPEVPENDAHRTPAPHPHPLPPPPPPPGQVSAPLVVRPAERQMQSFVNDGAAARQPNEGATRKTSGVNLPAAARARVGFREEGGPVEKGRTYVVGENGAELLTMKGDGYVTPNHAIDWEQSPQKSRLRDPQSFHRDTPAEQRATKRRYEDQAGKDADSLMASYQASLGQGSSLAELQKDANRRGAGFGYVYKDKFLPPEQASGELNWGPSAQQLEKNPLTATAVKKDATGMRAIDVNKMVKSNTAGIASLQEQLDDLEQGRRRRTGHRRSV